MNIRKGHEHMVQNGNFVTVIFTYVIPILQFFSFYLIITFLKTQTRVKRKTKKTQGKTREK